jgi:formylmethanofuran dehydrogenase subunit E
MKRKTQEQARDMFASRGAAMIGEYASKDKPVECVCDACGATVWPTFSSVKAGQGACIYCGGKARKTQNEARDMFASGGAAMIGKYINSKTGVKCECLTCGETIYPKFESVKSGYNACLKCSYAGRKFSHRKTQDEARGMFASRGATMVGKYTNKDKPVEGVCNACGATVWPTYGSMRNGQGACTGCAPHGFDSTKPGYLYLMAGDSDGLPWLKVGITNNDPADRAKEVGGTIIDSVLYENGAEAYRDEQELLGQLGDLRGTGIPQGGDGYTESWSAWLMTVTTLTELRERYAVAA